MKSIGNDKIRSAVSRQEQTRLDGLTQKMYREISQRMENPALNWVVKDKITALYGPPMVTPELAIVTFQGGGGDRSTTQFTWPNRLLYIEDDCPFGRRLRKEFSSIGLYKVLEDSAVAIAACFPEAPAKEAGIWLRNSNPWLDWRQFSSSWVRRMIEAMQPRVVLVFGRKASQALDIDASWQDEQFDHRGWRTFGQMRFLGCSTIYCQHLSQGASKQGVGTSLSAVRRILQP